MGNTCSNCTVSTLEEFEFCGNTYLEKYHIKKNCLCILDKNDSFYKAIGEPFISTRIDDFLHEYNKMAFEAE